jgi:hypothetical protein
VRYKRERRKEKGKDRGEYEGKEGCKRKRI